MTMRLTTKEAPSRGDGMTTDETGRIYVTTAVGIQTFDTFGRISGVIAKPDRDQGISNVVFAGPDRQFLYVTSGERVYRRKTQVTGAVFLGRVNER